MNTQYKNVRRWVEKLLVQNPPSMARRLTLQDVARNFYVDDSGCRCCLYLTSGMRDCAREMLRERKIVAGREAAVSLEATDSPETKSDREQKKSRYVESDKPPQRVNKVEREQAAACRLLSPLTSSARRKKTPQLKHNGKLAGLVSWCPICRIYRHHGWGGEYALKN